MSRSFSRPVRGPRPRTRLHRRRAHRTRWPTARRASGRPVGSARRRWPARSPGRVGTRRSGIPPGRCGGHIRPRGRRGCSSGVKTGTLPAITTTSNSRSRSRREMSPSTQVRSGANCRAVSIIDSSRSTPTVSTPRTGELPRHPTGPAPGVEDGRGLPSHDESGLAVDVGTRGGQPVEPFLIRPAVPSHHGINGPPATG